MSAFSLRAGHLFFRCNWCNRCNQSRAFAENCRYFGGALVTPSVSQCVTGVTNARHYPPLVTPSYTEKGARCNRKNGGFLTVSKAVTPVTPVTPHLTIPGGR